MSIDLTNYCYKVHNNAVEKGFWEPNNGLIFYLKQCAMIHSEVSELVDAISKNKEEQEIVEEMSDIIIRICDLWTGMQRDGAVHTPLETMLNQKAEKNLSRPRLHGKLA